jgi:guanylate kinase
MFGGSLFVFSGVRVTMIYKRLHRKLKVKQHENSTKTNNKLQNTTQEIKDSATRIPLKINNDLQNTTQKTKDRATRTPLKTNNDLQNTTQKTKDRATRTPLSFVDHCLL